MNFNVILTHSAELSCGARDGRTPHKRQLPQVSIMVVFYLKGKAELANVTGLEPTNSPQDPFEFQFTVTCTKCREQHHKPVSINTYEQYEITGSRGEASFVYRCRECKNEHSASIKLTGNQLVDDNDKWVPILEIDARGVDFNEFIAEGKFACVGKESGTKFSEVDLSDGEWYDYDEKAGEEVSITDVQWSIARS